MVRIAAMCGSRRRGSYNRMLLENAIERTPDGMEIFEVDVRDFPFYDQDAESNPPDAVTKAKRLIRSADCVLLVSPEYNYGVSGYLKNAVEWLSRPFGDPTLVGRPMALMGASTGHMGTIRGQLHWRQSWYFFRAPVFAEAELVLAGSADAFDADRKLIDGHYVESLDAYLVKLKDWLERGCTPAR